MSNLPPHLSEFGEVLSELNRESDRGLALVACSHIDSLLGRAIEAFLLEDAPTSKLLTGFNAPLGSLSARIAIARSLSILTAAEHAECEILRRIRNEFAHNIQCSFETLKIRDLCKNLRFDAKPYTRADGEPVSVDARGAFATAAISIILNLTNRPHYAQQQRLVDRTWKY